MQATGTLALTRLPPSANSTEILVMDQFGAVGSRGHMAHNKSCSWPSGIILRRVSLDRYLTHKAGTRAVAFVPSAWWRVQTGMLQILHQLIGNLEISPKRKIIGKALSHFFKFKNVVLIICNIVIGFNWETGIVLIC